MSHRKSKSSPTVTLFPFLAVLVCTMGALILLLLVTTRRVRQQAIAREVAAQMQVAEARSQPVLPDLPEPEDEAEATAGPLLVGPAQTLPVAPAGPTAEEIEAKRHAAKLRRSEQEAQWQRLVTELESRRAARKTAVDERRQLLATAEVELQASQASLAALHAQIKQRKLQQTKATATDQLFDSEQARVEQEIGGLQQKIADLKQQQAEASSRFAFIPYDGQSGTVRRPIFIECTSQGLRIYPEDELLAAAQLSGFTERYNPLLSGTQALLAYWSGQGTLKPVVPDQSRPYVLLLVRPSGTISYYLARRFLTHLGEPFGYELIDDDYPLSLPAPDAQAKVVLNAAIQETLNTRAEVLNSVTERKQVIDLKSFDPDSEPADDPFDNSWARNVPRPEPYKPGGSGSAPGLARSGAGSSPIAGSRGEMPDRPGGSINSGLGGGGQRATTANGGEAPFAEIGLHPEGDREPSSGPRLIGERPRATGPTAEFSDAEPLPPPRGNLDWGSPGTAPGGSAPAPRLRATSPDGIKAKNASGTRNGTASSYDVGTPDDSRFPNNSPTRDGVPNGVASSGNTTRPNGTRALNEARSLNDDGTPTSDARSEFQEQLANAGRRDAGSPAKAAASEDKPFRQSASGPTLIEELPGESLEAAREGTFSEPGRAGGQPAGTARRGAAAGSPTRASTSNASGDSGGPQGAGPPTGNLGPRRPKPSERAAMAKNRWGSARGSSSIGLEKTVNIAVTRDKILVGDGEILIPAGQGETRDELVEQVLQAIDEQSHGWGPPPANFFWIPAASFHVYPGGNQHYERLHAELSAWGLFSTAKFEVGEAPPTTGRQRPVRRNDPRD